VRSPTLDATPGRGLVAHLDFHQPRDDVGRFKLRRVNESLWAGRVGGPEGDSSQ